MRIFDGISYRDATPEEIEAFERAAIEEEERRKKQPPSDYEIVEALEAIL